MPVVRPNRDGSKVEESKSTASNEPMPTFDVALEVGLALMGAG